ncbi:MAG TPA: hypothetical protein VM261_06480 [Kofleriaceae bacterium]|nr:hypothetical protein [Kofleriaceae bacterium]
MRGGLAAAVVTVVISTTACGHNATQPQAPRGADLATREALYDASELTYVDRLGSRSWRRADGTYSLRTIESAVARYPDSREAHATVRQRSLAVSLIAGTGGGLVGFTAGYQLSAPERERMSNRAAYTLLGAGVVFIGVGLVLDRTWARDAARDMAATYNAALRRDLELPPAIR